MSGKTFKFVKAQLGLGFPVSKLEMSYNGMIHDTYTIRRTKFDGKGIQTLSVSQIVPGAVIRKVIDMDVVETRQKAEYAIGQFIELRDYRLGVL